jgi:apolipoprotein N-acyltransferase
MDVEEWGRHQHELHARIAPVRAAEYGVPIFRVASSGISQAVTSYGQVVAHTAMPGNGEIFAVKLRLPMGGARPPDRFLAPLCVALTGMVVVALLRLTWQERKIKIPAHDGTV